MRICLLVEAASGGAGRHVLDLGRALVGRGHDVTLVYSPLRSDAAFLAEAETSGATLVALAIGQGVGWRDVVAARALGRLIAERGPFAIVHAHSSKAGAVARLAAVGGAKRVYTPHALATLDPDRGLAARSLFGLAERMLGGRTDAMITVSAAEWVEAGRLGIASERRHLIANRLQAADFCPRAAVRARLGAASGEIWLGHVGRLAPQKAPLLFLAAAIAAMRRSPRVRALILGDGEQAGLVADAIAASGFDQRFVWHRRETAGDWLAALDLLIISSRVEVTPYVLLEAFAAGVPVLSTPVGEAAEWVPTGAAMVADSEALPGLLLALVADPERLERCASGRFAWAQAASIRA